MAISMEWATASVARFLPRLAEIRWYCAKKYELFTVFADFAHCVRIVFHNQTLLIKVVTACSPKSNYFAIRP